MTGTVGLWAILAASVAAVLLMFFRNGGRNVLAYLSAYFLLFADGPVVNYLLGTPVYAGVVVDRIWQAAVGFGLALGAILIVDLLYPQRANIDTSAVEETARDYLLLKPFLLLMTVYAAGAIVLVAPAAGGSKLARISAAGPGHRVYLFLEICAVSLYFVAQRSRQSRTIYRANLALYIVYCLITAERDFIFAIFAVVLIRQAVLGQGRVSRNIFAGAAGAYVAMYLVAARAGGDISLAALLGQGSVLFVDTFLYHLVPSQIGFMAGHSYVNSILNLLPGPVYKTDLNLAQWLLNLYAPTSQSGYGFSMSGEAYINFGMVGIPLIFAVTVAVQRFLTNRLDRSSAYGYFAILYTFVWMYGVRNDSLSILKSCLYGGVFFVSMRLASVQRKNARERSRG